MPVNKESETDERQANQQAHQIPDVKKTARMRIQMIRIQVERKQGQSDKAENMAGQENNSIQQAAGRSLMELFGAV